MHGCTPRQEPKLQPKPVPQFRAQKVVIQDMHGAPAARWTGTATGVVGDLKKLQVENMKIQFNNEEPDNIWVLRAPTGSFDLKAQRGTFQNVKLNRPPYELQAPAAVYTQTKEQRIAVEGVIHLNGGGLQATAQSAMVYIDRLQKPLATPAPEATTESTKIDAEPEPFAILEGPIEGRFTQLAHRE